jgi:type IV pilus assembly protein PilC
VASFDYKVINTVGRQEVGRMQGDTASQVADFLRGRGHRIVYIREIRGAFTRPSAGAKGKAAGGGFLSFLSRISIRDLSIFTNQFATMLNAGLSMSRALQVLQRQTTNSKLSGIIASLTDEVKKGNALSKGLEKYPLVFGPLYVSMVKAGEVSGNLGNALLTMSGFLQRDNEIRNKVKGAMTYPLAVLGFSIAVVLGLFIFVIPTFEGFLTQLGAPLPLPTKILFTIADFLIHRGWIVLIIIVVGVAAYLRWSKTPGGKRRLDALKLRLPVFGQLTKKSAMARFTDTLATLFSAGIPLVDCLDAVRGVIDNVIIGETISGIIDSIKKGESLSSAIERSGIFMVMVVEMTGIGEESGSLDRMLHKASEFYNDEVNYMVNNLTALINPIMMVFIGGIIASVLISLYLPVFQMASYVQ